MPPKTPTGPGRGLGHVAGVLERLPRRLEEMAVLRVHQLRFVRRDAEERRVEQLDVVEHAARRARRPDRSRWRDRNRRVELVRPRRRGSTRARRTGSSRTSRRRRAPGNRPANADDGDRLVAARPRRAARAASAAGGVDGPGQRRRRRRREEDRRRDLGQSGLAQPGQQRAAPAASCRRARRSRRARRPDRARARRRRPRRSSPRVRSPARDTAAPARAARWSGAGRAARSSLPLAVTGSAASATNADGTMKSGSTRGERVHAAPAPLRAPVAAPRRRRPAACRSGPRSRTDHRARRARPGSAPSRASISPSSMRKPRILTWWSARPTKSSVPSGRQRTRSPVRYSRAVAEAIGDETLGVSSGRAQVAARDAEAADVAARR